MEVRKDLKYTKEHEWVKSDEEEIVLGLTAHAVEQLGGITFFDLPDEGSEVSKGDEVATVESVKAASPVYAPATGSVIAVNSGLADQPETADESPYDDGWICRIKPSKPEELDELMDAASYEDYLKTLQ